jgi:HSP90 family molecular chaperone
MSTQPTPTVESLDPIADASEWIDQLSKPYKEVPWAVVRELFQNASDAIQDNDDGHLRLIELAILSKETKPSPDTFHLVLRDSGRGMSDEEIRKYLRVLGVGTKKT